MPHLGEIQGGRKLGYRDGQLRIYSSCPCCGKERWVELRKASRTCKSCWKKGKPSNHRSEAQREEGLDRGTIIDRCGYCALLLSPNHPFFPMARQAGYVFEHRLVVAQAIGRCLLPSEIVHHKNRDKKDNRLENLELVSREEHRIITILENRLKYLEKRVTILEAENVLLRREEEYVTTDRN